MSVISYLSAQVGRIAQVFRTSSRSVQSRAFSSTPIEVYPDINMQTAIDKGFNYNTAVYAIVMKYARKFGSIPRYLYDSAKYEEKSLTKPTSQDERLRLYKSKFFPSEVKAFNVYEDRAKSALVPTLTQLLNRPNPYLSQDLFYEGVCCYYKICGEAMIWLNRGDLEKYRNEDGSFKDSEIDKLPVLEMYVLPVNLIKVVPDPNNLWGILAYILDVGERKYIRRNDVIHWKSTNLSFNADTRTHLRGLVPLIPGMKSLAMHNSMTDSAVRGAQNDGAKYIIFNETMGAMNPTQQTDLKAVIDRKINNNDVKGSVATLQGKWGGIDLGKSSIDLQLMEGIQFSWKELCFLFDVPFEFFDPHTPFAEKQLAMIGWITNSMEPLSKQLDSEMNLMLLKAFDLEGKAFISCDYTGLPEMKKAAVDSARTLKETGVVSPNDIREYLGYERDKNPLMDEIWVTAGTTPVSKAFDDGTEPDEDVLKEIEKNYGKVGANGNGN